MKKLHNKNLIHKQFSLIFFSSFFLFYNFSLLSDKSVSFEKSVSFSDDIQGVPKTHSPQHLGKSMSLKITPV